MKVQTIRGKISNINLVHQLIGTTKVLLAIAFLSSLLGMNSAHAAQIIAPPAKSKVSGWGTIVTWADRGVTGIDRWWVRASKDPDGKNQFFNSGNIFDTSRRTVEVTGLPRDGSTVYVKLFYLKNGSWVRADMKSYQSVPVNPLNKSPTAPTSPAGPIVRSKPPVTTPQGGISLKRSGPVVASYDGQVIENLYINAGSSAQCGVQIAGYNNVTVRNVFVNHYNVGVCASDAQGVNISGVKTVSTSAPRSGPHCKPGVANCYRDKSNFANPDTRLSIYLLRTPSAKVNKVEVSKGSTGVSVALSRNVDVENVVCYDMRGPAPRGGCVQFANSSDGSLTNFYSKVYKDTSHDFDIINAWRSDNVVVQNGLIDGSYSINGVGIIADQDSNGMTVSNVDLINTTNSAVSVWAGTAATTGKNFTAKNINVKNTHCMSRHDNLPPSSGGVVAGIHPSAINPVFSNVRFANHCREFFAFCIEACREVSGGLFDIRRVRDVSIRSPLRLKFAWE